MSRPVTPVSEGSGDDEDGGWRDPTQFAEALGGDARWLQRVPSGQMDELSRNEMRRIADGIAELLSAANDAGVWTWPSAELQGSLKRTLDLLPSAFILINCCQK